MENYNWVNKEERSKIAKHHTEEMARLYGQEIKDCFAETGIYNINETFPIDSNNYRNYNTKIDVIASDSVSAARLYKDGYTAILNFASYKFPGGGFMNGSRAQEECLCHESYLYNVLKIFDPIFYTWNRNNLNKALYTNRGLFSPNVRFGDDFFDVITVAAPNFGTASKYQNVSKEENTKVLTERIKFVINIASANEVDTLILGAFGCGVFKQNPTEVATIFKDILKDYTVFKHVIFAIPSGHDEQNLKAFQKVFNS